MYTTGKAVIFDRPFLVEISYFRPYMVECLFSTRNPLKYSKTKVRENSRHMDIFDRQLFSTKPMGGKKSEGYFRPINFDWP